MMKKALFSFVLLCSLFLGGWTNPYTLSGGVGNAFYGDSNVKALWRFESGGLTIDSIGNNTLTNNGVTADTSSFKEGAASGNFDRTSNQYELITDANWTGPWKSTDSVKTGSICFWFYLSTLPGVGEQWTLWSKWDWTAATRSISIAVMNVAGTSSIRFGLGFNGGASQEWVVHATNLSATTWYHSTASYDNSDKSYALRLKNSNGDTVGSDVTGTATLDTNKLYVGTTSIFIGATNPSAVGQIVNGKMDEIVVFDDIVTATEATQIAKGQYGR